MNFDTLKRKMYGAQRARNALAVLLAVSIMGNAFQSWRMSQESTQVVLVPTRVSDGMVARGAVDLRYIEAVTLDAVYAMYTISPETVSYGRTVIERIAAAQDRARLLEAYDDIAADIRLRRISTVFRPEKIEHNMARLQVAVTGNLATYLDTAEVSNTPRKILLTYVEEGSSTRLSRVELVEIEE